LARVKMHDLKMTDKVTKNIGGCEVTDKLFTEHRGLENERLKKRQTSLNFL